MTDFEYRMAKDFEFEGYREHRMTVANAAKYYSTAFDLSAFLKEVASVAPELQNVLANPELELQIDWPNSLKTMLIQLDLAIKGKLIMDYINFIIKT